MMNCKLFLLVCTGFNLPFSVSAQTDQPAQAITIHFVHKANQKKIVQRDSVYTNAFNEPYRVNRLRYYISQISFENNQEQSIFLLDAFASDSLQIPVLEGRYERITFLLGVDSSTQTSGAQSGALDPLNNMFWTWNSGYVSFKLEGSSDSSTADLQRIEHHIGGYRKPYETMRKINLEFPSPFIVAAGEELHVYITVDLDKYWKSNHEIRIKDQALIMSSGLLPAQIADNLSTIFSIETIQTKP